jgi:predicted acylesterase/phospholipase RssA
VDTAIESAYSAKPGEKWWCAPDLVKVSGVFEGGGAKGVAYCGALSQLLSERVWFDAVAGASAGAITATLIAACVHPDDLPRKAQEGLELLAPSNSGSAAGRYLRLIRSVSSKGYALDASALHEWLGAELREFVGVDGVVTFEQLHDRGGIDLFIVAADVSLATPVIFNHHTTPKAEVAAAVVASSAIPLVLRNRRLRVHEPHRQVAHERTHVIVDGGVMANFPDFVFRDRSFRRYFNLSEGTSPVVGFILDEVDTRSIGIEELRESQFIGATAYRAPARSEVIFVGEDGALTSRTGLAWIGALVFVLGLVAAVAWAAQSGQWWLRAAAPLAALLGAAGLVTMALSAGSPEHHETAVQPSADVTDTVNGIADYPLDHFPAWHSARVGFLANVWLVLVSRFAGWFGLAMTALVLFGLSQLPHADWMSPVAAVRDAAEWTQKMGGSNDVTETVTFWWLFPKLVVVVVFVLAVLTIAIATATLLAAFAAFWATGRFVAESGSRLGQTLIRGAGTTVWAGAHPDDIVVKIPIPATVRTTSFSMDDIVRSELNEAGREAARGIGQRVRATVPDA